MKTITAKISKQGQLTIPAKVRKELDLDNAEVLLTVKGNKVTFEKNKNDEMLDKLLSKTPSITIPRKDNGSIDLNNINDTEVKDWIING